jgi:photosystem II stability/assembly factor-like uncharacterized protein
MSTASATDRLRGLNPVVIRSDSRLSTDELLLLERIVAQDRTVRSVPTRRAHQAHKGRLVRAGVLATVVLAVGVLLLVLVPGSGSNGPSTSAGVWRLVSFDSPPFRNLGSGQGQPGLQCVTDTICYSPSYGGNDPIYRTTDGGVHWTPVAPVPGADNGQIQDLRCTNALTCFFVTNSGLVVTGDGGASWTSIKTGTSGNPAGDAWCASAQRCTVAQNSGGALTAFATTTDGGAQWVTQPAPTVPGEPWDLTCDTSGSCLELVVGSATVEALTSQAWGGPWTARPSAAVERAAILYTSCSDATHCMLVFVGTSYQIITTSNAGITWVVSGPPRGWLNMPTAVGCANADQCWVAMSLYDSSSPDGAYSQPVIESTENFGQTWHPVSLPVTAPPIADVLTLSCPPSGAGCLAIGNGRDHFVLPRGPVHSLSGPILLSSLP